MVFLFYPSICASPSPPVRDYSKDVDLFRLACVPKQKAKEEADMTVAEAKAQLELTLGYLHLEEDSFSIRKTVEEFIDDGWAVV